MLINKKAANILSWTETFIKKIFLQLQGTADIQKQPDQ
jgi:hypothetical protein